MGLFPMPRALFGCLFAKELVVLFGSRDVSSVATVPTQYVLAATAVGFLISCWGSPSSRLTTSASSSG
jgi:hypothetical protein